MTSTRWHRCWNDPSIWRLFHVRPDLELLVTIDLLHPKLMAFELEWEDAEGRRRYLAWGHKTGFDAGVVNLEDPSAWPGGVADVCVRSTGTPDREALEMARRIVEGSGLGAPVGDWILSRLSA